MTNIKTFLLCIVLATTILKQIEAANCQQFDQQAQIFVDNYITSTTQTCLTYEQIQLLANLALASFERSKWNLIIQNKLNKAMNLLHQIKHNIAETRKNPALKQPENLKIAQVITELASAYDSHIKANETYTYALTIVGDTEGENSELFAQAFTFIRDHARHLTAKALCNQQKLFKKKLQELKPMLVDIGLSWGNVYKQAAESFEELKKDVETQIIRSLTVLNLSYVDKAITLACNESWQTLEALHELSQLPWHIVEQTRINFYFILYKKLYTILQNTSIKFQHKTILFNNQGLIDEQKRIATLPNPGLLL